MENKIMFKTTDLAIGHEDRVLCSGISFEIHEGDCIMLCGANGSGKTTLMKTILKKASNDEEMIMIPARIPKVAGFTLKEFVRLSCFTLSDLAGRLSPSQEEDLDNSIRALGLNHLSDRDISTLSDGEFQKAGIASALVRKASIIMLDEPTAFLDAQNRISILETLKNICCSGHRPAVIFSTHDLHDGLAVCNRVFAIGTDRTFHISADNTPEAKSETVAKIFNKLA